jgi:deoxyhypusine synthase
MKEKPDYLSGKKVEPPAIESGISVDRLIDGTFMAYNAGKLQKACRLFTERFLEPDVTVAVAFAGALTPAGLARSCLIPLVQHGFIDWMVTTGANLYHDAHFGLGYALRQGHHGLDDRELWKSGVVRIYDILIALDDLLATDKFMREVLAQQEFRREMSTPELHYHLGRYLVEREKQLGQENTCLLTVAYRAGVPLYVASPGDSSIALNVAELDLRNLGPKVDVSRDVNETAALVHHARKDGGRNAVLILGGGAPKNFTLQTEPQLQDILGFEILGFDHYIQVTDARTDTGGLSGATPSEAVSWGKVNPELLPDAIMVHTDITIALPLMTAYAMNRREPRPLRRLYDRRDELYENLKSEFFVRQKKMGRIPG